MFPIEDKIYVKIEDHWFDLTEYNTHPGGTEILKKYHLKDATIDFNNIRGHFDGFVDGLLSQFEIKNKLLIVFLNLVNSSDDTWNNFTSSNTIHDKG
jgi:cytochrome b involved in lipid metabolism